MNRSLTNIFDGTFLRQAKKRGSSDNAFQYYIEQVYASGCSSFQDTQSLNETPLPPKISNALRFSSINVNARFRTTSSSQCMLTCQMSNPLFRLTIYPPMLNLPKLAKYRLVRCHLHYSFGTYIFLHLHRLLESLPTRPTLKIERKFM